MDHAVTTETRGNPFMPGSVLSHFSAGQFSRYSPNEWKAIRGEAPTDYWVSLATLHLYYNQEDLT